MQINDSKSQTSLFLKGDHLLPTPVTGNRYYPTKYKVRVPYQRKVEIVRTSVEVTEPQVVRQKTSIRVFQLARKETTTTLNKSGEVITTTEYISPPYEFGNDYQQQDSLREMSLQQPTKDGFKKHTILCDCESSELFYKLKRPISLEVENVNSQIAIGKPFRLPKAESESTQEIPSISKQQQKQQRQQKQLEQLQHYYYDENPMDAQQISCNQNQLPLTVAPTLVVPNVLYNEILNAKRGKKQRDLKLSKKRSMETMTDTNMFVKASDFLKLQREDGGNSPHCINNAHKQLNIYQTALKSDKSSSTDNYQKFKSQNKPVAEAMKNTDVSYVLKRLPVQVQGQVCYKDCIVKTQPNCAPQYYFAADEVQETIANEMVPPAAKTVVNKSTANRHAGGQQLLTSSCVVPTVPSITRNLPKHWLEESECMPLTAVKKPNLCEELKRELLTSLMSEYHHLNRNMKKESMEESAFSILEQKAAENGKGNGLSKEYHNMSDQNMQCVFVGQDQNAEMHEGAGLPPRIGTRSQDCDNYSHLQPEYNMGYGCVGSSVAYESTSPQMNYNQTGTPAYCNHCLQYRAQPNEYNAMPQKSMPIQKCYPSQMYAKRMVGRGHE